jgi:D-alanine-D-alanine ligase
MHKIQKSIIVLRTSRQGYSSLSLVSANAIATMLQNYYRDVEVMTIASNVELEEIIDKQPDLVFTGIINLPNDESTNPEELVWISDYLESQGICHTGSESAAMQLSLHKRLAKDRVIAQGLRTARYIRVVDASFIEDKLHDLAFPLFVKPASLGGGEGIDEQSVVHDALSLIRQIKVLNASGVNDILVETYLSGKEYSVAILRNLNTLDLQSMPIELITPPNVNGDRLLSLKVKNGNAEQTLVLSDNETHKLIANFAIDVFEALEARDYGRIDIRCNEQGVPHFLEANLIPSLIKDYGSFPKSCALNQDMSYETMILSIINLALERVAPISSETIAPFIT